MRLSFNKFMDTQDKLISAKQMEKDWKKYFGMYVAVDDRDRLITYGKNREKVFEEAYNFFNNYTPIKFKIYKIFDTYEKQLIKSLLDYTW